MPGRSVYQSESSEKNRTRRRYVRRDVLQGNWPSDCRSWLGKSKAAEQTIGKDQLQLSGTGGSCCPQADFHLPQGSLDGSQGLSTDEVRPTQII